MRYPDGGGLSAQGRARREKLRLQAARMFEQDIDPVQVALSLRVSTKSAYQWRRRWRAGGPAALASRGAGGAACRLDDRQLARLRAALDLGPAANMKNGLGNLTDGHIVICSNNFRSPIAHSPVVSCKNCQLRPYQPFWRGLRPERGGL